MFDIDFLLRVKTVVAFCVYLFWFGLGDAVFCSSFVFVCLFVCFYFFCFVVVVVSSYLYYNSLFTSVLTWCGVTVNV